LKDTLDGSFDLGDYVVNMSGFIPYPIIITEPALGSFGGAMALVFISPKKKGTDEEKFRFPDITGAAGLYTLNNTWGAGALRQGSFPAIGLRYTVALGYADVKMNFYRDIPYFGEQEFLFNIKPLFAMLDLSENIYKNRIFGGLRYQFVKTWIGYDFPKVSDSIFDSEMFDKNLGTLGLYGEFDNRNSIFTPDRGLRTKVTYSFGRNFTASDVDINRLEAYLTLFLRPVKRWVCSFRLMGQGVNEGVPFYYYPYLEMRGIAMMRYQGQWEAQIETEQRVDVTRRWSVLGFVGTGRTWSDSKYMEDLTWHVAGGAGFRYLLARIFGLRMGIDIAAGPDQLSYYIVLGHYWNK